MALTCRAVTCRGPIEYATPGPEQSSKSVAILAISANIVGQTTVLFVRSHAQEARDVPIQRIAARAARPDSAVVLVTARWKDLALAIDRFQHASAIRAQRDTPLNQSEYLDAQGSLLKFDAVQFGVMTSEHTGARKLARDVKLFVEHGQILVRDATGRGHSSRARSAGRHPRTRQPDAALVHTLFN
jgi:hypothetical protein